MRLIRKRFVLRLFSVFAMLTTLNNIIYPTMSYALTSGPHQPEYTSYEDASATDMVNLVTGDFSFNTPLLSVPSGSSGSFPVSMSYHAGIGPDQEASWVGLGWNINVGSITRDINGFPDDALNDPQTVAVQQLNLGRGWTSQFLGSSIGWDSNKGHYGTVDLTLGFGMGLVGYGEHATYGIRGLSVTDGKVNFNAAAFAYTVFNAAVAVVSVGAGSIANQASGIASQAFGIGSNLLGGLFGSQAPDLGRQGYWAATMETNKHLFHTDYWVDLKQSRVEDMYGVLNLDKATTQSITNNSNFLTLKETINGSVQTLSQFEVSSANANKGAASDINIDLSSTDDYWKNASPATLAYDNFNVNGPGISGGIKPYRLETGSVSVPREMSTDHVRLNPVPYIDYGSAKVPFVYEGSIGNTYFNHIGGLSSVDPTVFYDGIDSNLETPGGGTNYIRYDLNDVTLQNSRIRSDVSAAKKIPQGHFVDWMNVGELRTTGGFSNSTYMDYFKGIDRETFRANFAFGGSASYYSTNGSGTTINFPGGQNVGDNFSNGQVIDVKYTSYHPTNPGQIISTGGWNNVSVSSHSANSIVVTGISIPSFGNPVIEVISHAARNRNHTIGGFVITDPGGTSYHYALPVYDYEFFSKTWKKSDPTNLSTISRNQAFANTWLLTAITGPDFVDRGGVNNVGDGYIDENDWGYWVKFNYGRPGGEFAWATPHNKQKPSSDDLYYTYASGKKEKYFLNSVETRSHVALFIKSVRNDARDAQNNSTNNLKIDEIDLITKETYKKLVSDYGMPDLSGRVDDWYSGLTFIPTSNKANFLYGNAIRRIIFNQDYTLCPNTPTSNSGKLTLKSITVAGRYDPATSNLNKMFPDYKFEYASNPSYGENNWDGWGMYSSVATASGQNHRTSRLEADGSAWSLSKIITPQGSEILIGYERDQYTNISGESIPDTDQFSIAGSYGLTFSQANISGFTIKDYDYNYVKPGDLLKIKGKLAYKCPGSTDSTYVDYNTSVTVTSVTHTSTDVNEVSVNTYGTINCPNGQPVTVKVRGKAVHAYKKGGNLRVRSLELKDPMGQSYKSTYEYSNGSVAMEPDYIRTSDLSFYKKLNYPNTPVMYGAVTVYNGSDPSSYGYDTKTVYNFKTPVASIHSISTDKERDQYNLYSANGYTDYSSVMRHRIELRSSQIGKVTSISTYERNNSTPVSQTTYTYTENMTNDGVNKYGGIFSEGTLLFEAVMQPGTNNRYHRAQRTTMLNYPCVLQKVETVQDGFTTKTENKNWDLFTGSVLETRATSPLGEVMQTITIPAYIKYPALGSKAKGASYKNMLSQQAATYTYRLDGSGNQTGLISASTTTWKKDWSNYRVFDVGQQKYINVVDSSAASVGASVWRPNQNFQWKGTNARIQADGTQSFSAGDLFNFATGSANTNWQNVSAIVRYDHNSTPLETIGVDKIYSASKMGYSNAYPIASASNAHFEEIAFSGAEDLITNSPSPYFLGGEVSLTNGTVVTSPVHTGAKALSVSTGYGFVFKSDKLYASKTYRASVWSNSPNGTIYYKINGSASEVSNPPQTQTQVGSWYKIDCVIPAGVTSIEIGVKSNSGVVVFDDFRFQPLQSAMTTYVYDPATHAVTHSLDNDNLYTRFEYSKRGLLIKTYSETIRYGGERLISESKDDYKRFHTN